jgi:hypothetical protein
MKKIALLLAATTLAASAFAGNITVKGSDTLVILAQKWAEVYMGQHADTKIQVSGGGSGTGFAALQKPDHRPLRRLAQNQGGGIAEVHRGLQRASDRIQGRARRPLGLRRTRKIR